MGRFYVTTAIDYANGDPHIGHAYEKIGTDVIARYKRLAGDDVHFLTGMDEHGQKVAQAAAERGVSPQEFYDEARVAIVPTGFCFPGQDEKGADLPPRRECAPLWHRKLFAALPQIELVLAIGSYAQRFHLGDEVGASLHETMLAWRQHLRRKRRPRVLPLPHPSWRNNAWLKQNPWFETELLPVLRRRVRALL